MQTQWWDRRRPGEGEQVAWASADESANDRALPAPARRAVTIYDIAREAGVSHQSVSRFIRGFEQRASTRERIEHALEQLEYRPNLTARSLVTGRSHRLGALTHEINHLGPSQVLQGASTAARDAGFLLDIVSLDMGNVGEIAQSLEILLQHELAGVVALASTDEMRSAVTSLAANVPILLVSEAEESPTDTQTSELNGIPHVMTHLIGLGHQNFAHISGPPTWSAARNRRRAYEHAIAQSGLTSHAIIDGDWSARSGYDAAQRILMIARPTAIVAANDQMALGAILSITDNHLRVPDDISVTGIDDTPEAAFYSPPLTTVRIDFRAEGRNAITTLLKTLDQPIPDDSPIHAPQLIVRKSTSASA